MDVNSYNNITAQSNYDRVSQRLFCPRSRRSLSGFALISCAAAAKVGKEPKAEVIVSDSQVPL
jgi:hypothetical protein